MSSTAMRLRRNMALCMKESMLHDVMTRDGSLAAADLDGMLSNQVAACKASTTCLEIRILPHVHAGVLMHGRCTLREQNCLST